MSRELPRRAASPLLAVVLHALAAAVVYRTPLVPREEIAPAVQSSEAAVDVSFEPEAKPESESESERERERERERPVVIQSPVRQAPALAPTTGLGEATAETAAESGVRSEAPASSAAPIALGPARAPDLGIGKNPFLVDSPGGKTRDEHAVERSLRDVAEKRDRELGLGPEGPVLTALSEGTSQSLAPVRGRAVFSATSNENGEVVSIDVLDTEGGRPGWVDAARIALERLKGKKLRVRPGTVRTVMKIEVTSAWKLPSGQDPGTDVTLFHVPIAKGEGKDSAQMAILDPIPKFRVENVEVAPGVVIPLLSIEIDLFRTTADPSNIGAKARRIIHTHVIESTAL